MARIQKEYRIEVRWVAYPLNPFMPGTVTFGFAPDSAYDPRTITQKTTRTRLAQELTKWAESEQRGEAFRQTVWQALYRDRKDIADREMLFDLVESAGLKRDSGRVALETESFKDTVDADWRYSLQIDPSVVPSLLLNGDLLENPQRYKTIENMIVRHRVNRRN